MVLAIYKTRSLTIWSVSRETAGDTPKHFYSLCLVHGKGHGTNKSNKEGS